MGLDIERLHTVVSGGIVGEKIGNTTAKIEEIISCIQLQQCKHIIVTTSTMKAIADYEKLLWGRANDLGLPIDWFSTYAGYINNVVVRFKLKDESLNGYDDYYLVEVNNPRT